MIPHQQRRRRRRAVTSRTPEKRVTVTRGPGGFGFTIAGQRPCVVSAVALDSPAERAGLRAGDALLAVDGANVSRVPHGAVARLIAAAPQAISLIVIPRECPPTDTEDTEPDERARTRRRHPPPRRRPQQPPLIHRPGCHAGPSSSSNVNEILKNITRAQLSPSSHAARLECRAIVGYLGTIETPRSSSESPPGSVRNAVRRLRQERRPATPVLLSVLPNILILRSQTGQALAQYNRERIVYAGSSSDADRRYFGLVTSAAESGDPESSFSCHVFSVDPRLEEHQAHIARAREFQIGCTRDPVAERCLEFPPSAEYVVGVIKGMYSLPAEDTASPVLQQISKLAIKGDSPGLANFSRYNRPALRVPRLGRRPRYEENGQEFVANSPQPSNHSEITTTSSNSDSGIGFHNDNNIAERILVVDFAQPMIPHRRNDAPRRPIGVVGCNVEDGSFLSNTTPVVDGFGGQGRPLNHLDDVILNPTDMQHLQGAYKPREENNDSYNFNSIQYSNIPSTSRMNYENSENECHYELIPPDICLDNISEGFNSVEFYEESRPPDLQSNEAESIDNVTVISGTASKASMDSVSIYSAKSQEEPRPLRERHLQASLDDMLLGINEAKKDDDNFLHPSTVKCKVRKSKPMNLFSKTKYYLSGNKKRNAERTLSASAGDVCAGADDDGIHVACSEPDLRQSDQSSPFRRWTTGSGAGSSYRHHDHRNMYNKQISENTATTHSAGSATSVGSGGGVARWSLGLEHLLADPAGAAAFAHFLHNEFAGENIRFWWSCEQYRASSESRRAELATEIWQRYLCDGAPDPVNVDAAARRAAQLTLHQHPPDPDLFLQAQKQIFNVMKFDSYPRFLRSGVHAECARADLRGQPPPFGTHSNDEHSPTKLKKSASNASERRRSGGASLLPWKIRTASRERTNHATAQQTESASVTDVVKQSTSSSNGFALCRVVLPDGATSVVGVDPAMTVRRLLDKLLQRRNITCSSYDVLAYENVNGTQSETHIDVTAPSTELSGREVRVERRCVVRVEITGRCVAVRCRAHRSIRHALRPVLRRYCPQYSGEPVLTKDGVNVHLDTLIQDLDGSRLQVTFAEESDLRSSSIEVKEIDNEDLDSMNELAVRLHEDLDSQSTISSSRSEYGTSGNHYGTNGIHGSSGNNNYGGVYTGNLVGGAGRVRAALRPGPPLHHHPPDFLDNLRETQRKFHGTKNTDTQVRSPPPLPPKPRPAPPTNV